MFTEEEFDDDFSKIYRNAKVEEMQLERNKKLKKDNINLSTGYYLEIMSNVELFINNNETILKHKLEMIEKVIKIFLEEEHYEKCANLSKIQKILKNELKLGKVKFMK